MSKRPIGEAAIEKSLEREFKKESSKSASLDGDADIIARIMRRWYGDEAWRVAHRVAEGLKS